MICGNITAVIQTYTVEQGNISDKRIWADKQNIKGWLDLQSGDSRYSTFSAKIQESTHIFVSDYVPLADGIRAENSRMIINGKRYDIMLIDDPMEMHKHLEIFLRFTGGQ